MPLQTPDEYRRLGPPLGPEAEGQRADGYLARTFPFRSRQEWKGVCQAGHLLVNEKPVGAAHRLRNGDQLAVYHPEESEPDVDTRVTLITREGGLMALFKPGNLPMHEAGLYRRKTFGSVLAQLFGPEWAPVHRLDRETSGLVLCAATPELRAVLTREFFEQRVNKTYVAILAGRAAWSETVVDRPIVELPVEGPPRYGVGDDGAPACTEFSVREVAPQGTLVDVRPRTGRTNQIRVHAEALGHPLLGDKIYHADPAVYRAYHKQGDSPAVRRLAGFDRHALHAASLTVRHPETGRQFAAEAPLPDDLANLWERLKNRNC